MISSLKIQRRKKITSKIIFMLSVFRRCLTNSLGAHQLDAPSYYCKGNGLEIGASDCPYPFPLGKVDYADFNDSRFSDVKDSWFIPLTPPKCFLQKVSNSQYDFVYASHVLEHTPNPLRTIQEWVRVVRCGGIIYIVVPNMQKTYDRLRDVTNLNVLRKRFIEEKWDFTFDEIRLMVEKTVDLNPYDERRGDLEEFCQEIKDNPDGTHHYFVFSPTSMIEFAAFIESEFKLEMINLQAIRHEIHVVLRKIAP